MTSDRESVDNTVMAPLMAGAGKALLSPLPAGADPDEVRDWFEFETIVELPAPALSFAEAEAAAADYRRAARAENTQAGLSRRRRPLYRLVLRASPDRVAGIA